MTEKIVIDENYTHTGLFERMRKGDVFLVPYEEGRHNGIKQEAARTDIKYRVSKTENEGYTTIACIK